MRSIHRMIVAVAVVCLTGPAAIRAQGAHVNFSGVWTLDRAKSDTSAMAPSSAIFNIVQHGDSIVMDRETTSAMGGTVKTHFIWGIDGKPWTNTVSVAGQDAPVSSVLSWAAEALVIRTSGIVQGTAFEQVETMTMAADGRSLSDRRSVTAAGTDYGTITLVFAKQN